MLWALLTDEESYSISRTLCSYLDQESLNLLSLCAQNARSSDDRIFVPGGHQPPELLPLEPFRYRLCLLAGKGWGVVSEEHLEKGRHIAYYTGEYINNSELQRRLASTTASGRMQFIMTNREHIDNATVLVTNIDASRVGGGIARFFNHSCQGNMRVVMHRSAGNVLAIPVLVVTHDIKAQEEMTFNYGGEERRQPEPKLPDLSATRCFCGSPGCIGRLPL